MVDRNIGETLAAARRARGLSLHDAEEATRVRAKMLEALEKGDYETLPAPAYVRGYIMNYAKYLELDPAPLLKRYAEETGASAGTRDSIDLPEQVVKSRHETHAVPMKAALIIMGVIVVIALAVWGIGRIGDADTEEVTPLPNVPSTTTVEPTETIAPSGEMTAGQAPVDTETTAPEPAGVPFTLSVAVDSSSASWLRVTVDGLKAYEGTLPGGQTKEWEVTDSATIRIGQPSAVTVLRDGVEVEIPTNANTPEMTLSVTDSTQ